MLYQFVIASAMVLALCLFLNPDKSEVPFFGMNQKLQCMNLPSTVIIAGCSVVVCSLYRKHSVSNWTDVRQSWKRHCHNLPFSYAGSATRSSFSTSWCGKHDSLRDHQANDVLQELYCLPVRNHITFKVTMLWWKAHQLGETVYLKSLLHPYIPACTLCSSDRSLPELSASRTKRASRWF